MVEWQKRRRIESPSGIAPVSFNEHAQRLNHRACSSRLLATMQDIIPRVHNPANLIRVDGEFLHQSPHMTSSRRRGCGELLQDSDELARRCSSQQHWRIAGLCQQFISRSALCTSDVIERQPEEFLKLCRYSSDPAQLARRPARDGQSFFFGQPRQQFSRGLFQSRAHRSACANALHDGKRWLGSLRSARSIAAFCLVVNRPKLRREYGLLNTSPSSIAHSTSARLYWSDLREIPLPPRCSGDANPGEYPTAQVATTVWPPPAATVERPRIEIPKSDIRTSTGFLPRSCKRILPGLMS